MENEIKNKITNLKNKFEDVKKLSKALMGYPELYMHPVMLSKAKKDYEELSKKNGLIDQLYDTLPYTPSGHDKSNIRHPYANAQLIRKYPEEFVRALGKYKEDVDLLDNKPMWDTEEDLINNEYGIGLGKEYMTAPDIVLFDRIIDNFGLPVPQRDVLHGYVQKTPDDL